MGNIQYSLSTVLDISPFNPGLKRLSVSESWETFSPSLSTVLDISPFNPGLKRLSVSESWETFNTV